MDFLLGWPLPTSSFEGRRPCPLCPSVVAYAGQRLCPPELWLGGAEDAVVVLHVGAAVTGVLHVQRVVQKVQVLLHLGDMLCRVLLRVQDLRGIRGVRLARWEGAPEGQVGGGRTAAQHPSSSLCHQPVPWGPPVTRALRRGLFSPASEALTPQRTL